MNLQRILGNWKTTLGGAGMLLGGLAGIVTGLSEGGDVNWEINGPLVVGGWSMMMAKDASVTGTTGGK